MKKYTLFLLAILILHSTVNCSQRSGKNRQTLSCWQLLIAYVGLTSASSATTTANQCYALSGFHTGLNHQPYSPFYIDRQLCELPFPKATEQERNEKVNFILQGIVGAPDNFFKLKFNPQLCQKFCVSDIQGISKYSIKH